MPVLALPSQRPALMRPPLHDRILDLIFEHRRLLPGSGPCAAKPCCRCYMAQARKIAWFLERKQPVRFILPAYPHRSTNLQKVLGSSPDMSEWLSLGFLSTLCHRIGEIYSPGAEVVICSDGRVFSDLWGMADRDVIAYQLELAQMIDELGGDNLSLFTMDDIYGFQSGDYLRAQLLTHHGTAIPSLRERMGPDLELAKMFESIQHLVNEDVAWLMEDSDSHELKSQSVERAYTLLQRELAWNELTAARFPHSMFLSVHAQTAHSPRIGLRFIASEEPWRTPWHGVVLQSGTGFTLVKREQAEAWDATLVHQNGRPSYFSLH